MTWLALVNWLLVAMLALGAARVPLTSLGLQAFCALGGLGAMVVFAAGGASAFAWISFALACLGTLAGVTGAHTLAEDSSRTMMAVGQHRKESAAAFEGAELPFFATAALLSLAVAVV